MPETVASPVIREQLVDRRTRLEREIARSGATSDLERLVQEVDAALARVSAGT